jgi:hypothetical protein
MGYRTGKNYNYASNRKTLIQQNKLHTNYSIIKTGKSWKITYREYNKLDRITYYIQLNKELMHTMLSHIIRW